MFRPSMLLGKAAEGEQQEKGKNSKRQFHMPI
jgi:hypothetical protein